MGVKVLIHKRTTERSVYYDGIRRHDKRGMSRAHMTSKASKLIYGAALGLLMVGAGCGGAQPAPSAPAPQAQQQPETGAPAAPSEQPGAAAGTQPAGTPPVNDTPDAAINLEADASVGALKEVKLTAKQFSFSPSEVRVKKGERVRLVVTSEDVSHGIAIPAFNVNLQLNPGDTGTAEFVADKAGSYPFFCNVFCGSGHRDMKGTLIVE